MRFLVGCAAHLRSKQCPRTRTQLHQDWQAAVIPELSVVVVPLVGGDQLRRCLEALLSQVDVSERLAGCEVIVPHDESLTNVGTLRQSFLGVRFLGIEGARTYAELRAFGVRESRGKVVALTEDHCIPEMDWCLRICEAHESPSEAIGGAVEKADIDNASSWSWATYFSDWARYMRPLPEGPARELTDCNVSYKRAALESIVDSWQNEFHEPVVHSALRARGGSLWLTPRIVVRQHREFSMSSALRERFHFGHLFGATRVPRADLKSRALYALSCPLLPGISVARAAANVLRKRRHRAQLVRVLPSLITLASVWASGEFCGYLLGESRNSPSEETFATRNINGWIPE